MDLDAAVASARSLVLARFPDARAAWLAGSVVAGTATATSDLDVTVLLAGAPAPFRESLVHDGWPVELFVHDERSLDHWVAKDRDRRRPTLLRLVATGVVLVDVDGVGTRLRSRCATLLDQGPVPPRPEDLDAWRYGLTDLLDDLFDAGDPGLRAAVAVATWQSTAELLLGAAGRWWGTGKWLVRELRAHDAATGTAYAERLHRGLVDAVAGDPAPLTAVADDVLSAVGGRLFAGYRVGGVLD